MSHLFVECFMVLVDRQQCGALDYGNEADVRIVGDSV